MNKNSFSELDSVKFFQVQVKPDVTEAGSPVRGYDP